MRDHVRRVSPSRERLFRQPVPASISRLTTTVDVSEGDRSLPFLMQGDYAARWRLHARPADCFARLVLESWPDKAVSVTLAEEAVRTTGSTNV